MAQMSRWWRLYDEVLDDPKVQRLPCKAFKFWVNLLCVCSMNGGSLPSTIDIAFRLKMRANDVKTLLGKLRDAGLIDEYEQGLRPHNWDGRQFKSDVSRDRMRRHRERHRNVTRNVTVTPPDTDTDTDTERSKREDKSSLYRRGNGAYAFEEGVVRLNQHHFDQWTQAYSYLDLRAELLSLSSWLTQEHSNNWFVVAQKALAKKNRDAKLETDRRAKQKEDHWNDPMDGII